VKELVWNTWPNGACAAILLPSPRHPALHPTTGPIVRVVTGYRVSLSMWGCHSCWCGLGPVGRPLLLGGCSTISLLGDTSSHPRGGVCGAPGRCGPACPMSPAGLPEFSIIPTASLTLWCRLAGRASACAVVLRILYLGKILQDEDTLTRASFLPRALLAAYTDALAQTCRSIAGWDTVGHHRAPFRARVRPARGHWQSEEEAERSRGVEDDEVHEGCCCVIS